MPQKLRIQYMSGSLNSSTSVHLILICALKQEPDHRPKLMVRIAVNQPDKLSINLFSMLLGKKVLFSNFITSNHLAVSVH